MARTVTAVIAPARTRRPARRIATALITVAVGAGSALGLAGTAAAAPVTTTAPAAHVMAAAHVTPAATPVAATANQFLSLLNAHRVANHEAPLTVSTDLVSVATAWSAKMAGGAGLAHNPKLASQVKNWQVVGENVGDGSDVATLDKAFWASPEHRANELYKPFSQVGIGVVISKGTVWVTFDFRQPMKAAK